MEICDKIKERSKQKFSIAWLSDNRYKSWIHQVSSDDTLFLLQYMQKKLSCSSHVSWHADSACHKKNMEENVCTNSANMQERKACEKAFRQQWLDINDFKLWLREEPNNVSSYLCIICDRAIVANLSHIYRHAESKMHKKRSGKSDIANKSNKDLNMQTNESLLTFDEQKKLQKFVMPP